MSDQSTQRFERGILSAELIDGYTLNVTRHDAGTGFTIQVVELPGCIAVSPTTEGIRHATEVAIAVHLDALKPPTDITASATAIQHRGQARQ
jgi:hypothetical protein